MAEYNQYDPFYKTPQGALRQGEKACFRICAPEFESVSLTLQEDGSDASFCHEMRLIGDGVFEVRLSIAQTGLYYYAFLGKNGQMARPVMRQGEQMHQDNMWQLLVYAQDFETPDWIKGGVIYQIFVDRFAKEGKTQPKPDVIMRDDWGGVPYYRQNAQGKVENRDFFGGNLEGIIGKLPYLAAFSVTAIYLSPIFDAHSNHKYDTGDYMNIDSMFGTEEQFVRLIAKAAEYGIKIICDGVFSHTGDDSIYFNKYGHYDSVGAYQSKESPCFRWYSFENWNEDYDCWWGIKILPQVNETEPDYLEFITGEGGVLDKWTRMGVSWRLDVADELPDLFLDSLRMRVKKVNPDALIIGEVWEDASTKSAYGRRRRYLQGAQLDSVMNYPFKEGIIGYLKSGDATRLSRIVEDIIGNYPACVLHSLMNIIGTHDTERILTVLGSEKLPGDKIEMEHFKLSQEQYETGKKLLKIAALLQFTLPGVPSIYYGDEAGMQGCCDPFNRICYPWGEQDRELMEWYAYLGKLRKDNRVFVQGNYQTLYARGTVLVYQRTQENSVVLVATNASDQPFCGQIAGAQIELGAYECRVLVRK